MKTLTLILIITASLGCATGGPVFQNEEGWVVDNKRILFFSWADYYYCRAHKSADGINVSPVCYRAEQVQRNRTYFLKKGENPLNEQ